MLANKIMIINEDLVIGNTNRTFKKIIPVTLYTATDSAQGDIVPITLNDDWNKYEYLEIWFNGYYFNDGGKSNPVNYGIQSTKMWTQVPYISDYIYHDGGDWGGGFQVVFVLNNTRELSVNPNRGYYFGGSEKVIRQWWKTRYSATILKVVGYRK